MEKEEIFIGYITTENKAKSVTIASKLLEEKLIACCNIVPLVNSIYMWEGKVCVYNLL